MKTEKEIEEAAERAADLQNAATDNGTKYGSMTYEDGLRDALDWVCEYTDEDPTNQ